MLKKFNILKNHPPSGKLEQNQFTNDLLHWNNTENDRIMPWKGEKNPYKIWISEVILQQTRVEQGLSYYLQFIKAYPTVKHLAKAPDAEVFKLWEGLGYYSRCRNMLYTARYIVQELNGKFPNTYNDLIKLKGIGPYTAAAISSFAYQEPRAVVDGNVTRVLARYFGIDHPPGLPEGKNLFTSLANELIPSNAPGIYNQAIMDFGATICKPTLPLCESCPLANRCYAYKYQKQKDLPTKIAKNPRKKRWFYYFLLNFEEHVLIKERTEKDIWRHLWEFTLHESATDLNKDEIEDLAMQFPGKVINITSAYKQVLTHQEVYSKFITVQLNKKFMSDGYNSVPYSQLTNYSFPVTIRKFLADMSMNH